MTCVSDAKLKIVHAGWEGFPQELKLGDVSVALTARLKRLWRNAAQQGKTTTGAEARSDAICFTRPWKGRSSTREHALFVFKSARS
jgi:hypothetical protein